MRRGMQGLALQVQETLGRDPHAGDLYVFRGRSGNLIKIIWHDGLGMSLYAKRLLGELGHIGGNLNQIARGVNFGDDVDMYELTHVLADLGPVRDAILKALGREP